MNDKHNSAKIQEIKKTYTIDPQFCSREWLRDFKEGIHLSTAYSRNYNLVQGISWINDSGIHVFNMTEKQLSVFEPLTGKCLDKSDLRSIFKEGIIGVKYSFTPGDQPVLMVVYGNRYEFFYLGGASNKILEMASVPEFAGLDLVYLSFDCSPDTIYLTNKKKILFVDKQSGKLKQNIVIKDYLQEEYLVEGTNFNDEGVFILMNNMKVFHSYLYKLNGIGMEEIKKFNFSMSRNWAATDSGYIFVYALKKNEIQKKSYIIKFDSHFDPVFYYNFDDVLEEYYKNGDVRVYSLVIVKGNLYSFCYEHVSGKLLGALQFKI